MSPVRKFVIVGGGITGMFVAYFLHKDGYEVTIADKDTMGQEASVYNAGLLTPSFAPAPKLSKAQLLEAILHRSGPLYISPSQILSNPSWYLTASSKALSGYEETILKMGHLSLDLYRRFFDEERINPDIIPGVLGLYHSREDAATFARRVGGELVSADEIVQMGYKGLEGGVYLKSEYSVNPERLFSDLRRRIQEMGVHVALGVEAKLKKAAGKTECLVDGDRIDADAIVVTAGSWARPLLRDVGYSPEVLPASGLVLLYETGNRKLIPHPTLLEDYGVAIAQHNMNTLRVTSFFEMVGFRREYSQKRIKWLTETVSEHVTDLSHLRQVGGGVGFRPCTPDQFPIIGKVPHQQNIFVATGNCRLGLTLAPATATILASIIGGTECLDEIKPQLDPSRF